MLTLVYSLRNDPSAQNAVANLINLVRTKRAPAPVPVVRRAATEETSRRQAPQKMARQPWKTTRHHHPARKKVPAIIKGGKFQDDDDDENVVGLCLFLLRFGVGNSGMGWIGVAIGIFIIYSCLNLYSMGILYNHRLRILLSGKKNAIRIFRGISSLTCYYRTDYVTRKRPHDLPSIQRQHIDPQRY